MQNSFLPGGSLAVADGEQVVPVINRIGGRFAHVVLTRDRHTPYGDQVLWPDHCVHGTPGADISGDIAIPMRSRWCARAFHKDVDSIRRSRADHATPTGLAGYLRERPRVRLFVAGLVLAAAWGAARAGVRRIQSSDLA